MTEENKETTTEEVVEKKEEVVATPKKKGGKGVWVLVLLVVLAAVLFALFKNGAETGKDGVGAVDAEADTVVATVLDVTITRGELDEKLEQVKLSLPEGQMDPTEDAAFELRLLNDLVDLELLKQAAKDKNYTVTSDEIDAEIALIIEQFPSEDEFYAQLETVNISREELRENIETEMHIRRLLEEETDLSSVEVTDAEMRDVYTSSVGDAEGMPTFEEVREVILAQLEAQKSAEIVETYVAALRENAEIEIAL